MGFFLELLFLYSKIYFETHYLVKDLLFNLFHFFSSTNIHPQSFRVEDLKTSRPFG